MFTPVNEESADPTQAPLALEPRQSPKQARSMLNHWQIQFADQQGAGERQTVSKGEELMHRQKTPPRHAWPHG